jgi:DNA polymerase III alpha subunit
MSFPHLHVASAYSTHYGVTLPETLVELAAAQGADFLAFTDRDVLYGAVVGRAELERKVIKQLAFMDGDDDLPVVLLRKKANESSELCHMHFVHGLDGVIEDKTRDDRFDGEVKRQEEGQCCGVQVSRRQHHLWRAAGFAVAVSGLQLDVESLFCGTWDTKAWDEPFIRREPGEY